MRVHTIHIIHTNCTDSVCRKRAVHHLVYSNQCGDYWYLIKNFIYFINPDTPKKMPFMFKLRNVFAATLKLGYRQQIATGTESTNGDGVPSLYIEFRVSAEIPKNYSHKAGLVSHIFPNEVNVNRMKNRETHCLVLFFEEFERLHSSHFDVRIGIYVN